MNFRSLIVAGVAVSTLFSGSLMCFADSDIMVLNEKASRNQTEFDASKGASIRDLYYWMGDRVIHLKNDDNLKSFLRDTNKSAIRTASYLKQEYRKDKGRDINITDESMALELLGHVYPHIIAPYLPDGRIKTWILDHADVIDSGELEVDWNRDDFDRLARLAGWLVKSASEEDQEISRKIREDIKSGKMDPMLVDILKEINPDLERGK